MDSPKAIFTKEQFEKLTALKCAVFYNKYGGYCVPASSRHRPAAKKIISNDVWEPKTIDFIMSNCGNGDVVHAGTYFGDFLPALSKGAAADSKVWAFEPNPESYRCARITLELNDITNTVLINAGLGSKQEKLFMKTVDKNGYALGGLSQIIGKESDELNGTEFVQIFSVDDIIGTDRNVSIIQLDIEGHEKEALTGALKIIKRCRPIIILEVWPNSTLLDSNWFSENILRLGYQQIDDIHENVVFKCESQD